MMSPRSFSPHEETERRRRLDLSHHTGRRSVSSRGRKNGRRRRLDNVTSIFLPAQRDAPSPRTGEKAVAGNPRAATARGR
ncbi:hypothetical protein BHE74_00051064, partial [Ensete ventricosum]